MARKLHEMVDVRLSVEFKKCYLQSTASFSVAAKSLSQVQTILCREVEGKTEQQSSHWRAFHSLCSFLQQGSRVSALTLLGYFIWLYSACVSLSDMQLQRAVSCWGEKCCHPSPPSSANCFVLLAKSFFVVPFLSTSSALLSCTSPDACLLTILPLDFSPRYSTSVS